MASAVCTPCPISARGTATTTPLSRVIFTQPLRPASFGLTLNSVRFAQAIALAGEPEADAQKAAAGDAADDRHAPGPLLHGAPPSSAAARCTARRTAL